MITERTIQLEAADQAEFERFQDYLNQILEKYGSDVFATAYGKLLSEAMEHDVLVQCGEIDERATEVANRMVQGAGVYICVGCIDLCYKVRQQWPE